MMNEQDFQNWLESIETDTIVEQPHPSAPKTVRYVATGPAPKSMLVSFEENGDPEDAGRLDHDDMIWQIEEHIEPQFNSVHYMSYGYKFLHEMVRTFTFGKDGFRFEAVEDDSSLFYCPEPTVIVEKAEVAA